MLTWHFCVPYTFLQTIQAYVAYKAVEFIEDNEAKGWFLYVKPTVPHGPSTAAAIDVDCRKTTDVDFTASMSSG